MHNQSMDHKIKKYFEHRTIDPSTQAWDRLDSMLTVAEKPKKRFTIYYVLAFAASLVTILVMFIGPSNEQLETIEVTNQVAVSQNSEIEKEVKVMENEVVQTKDVINEHEVGKLDTKRKATKSELPKAIQSDIVSNDIFNVRTNKTTVIQEDKPSRSLQSVDVVASEVVSPKVEEKKSTFKIDPEALLASITNVKSAPTKTDVATNTKRRRIDPNTLLDEAENVVAKGFLVRALSSLKETSDEILTSVSNRNQEKQR
jgi:DNA-directed RNA polymerase subunit H (RpoH/RPB5)